MMGLVSEYFRRRPDVVRSLHPTHPILVHGPDAEAIVAAHPACLYPCGPDTPFDRLLALDGKVVFFNVEFAVFTFFHYLEHLRERATCRSGSTRTSRRWSRWSTATATHGRSRPTCIRAKRSSAVASRCSRPNCGGAALIKTRRIGNGEVEAIRVRDASTASTTCGGRAATSTTSSGLPSGDRRRCHWGMRHERQPGEPDSFLDFAGRWVVVTGASSGLGRAIAIELSRHGATPGAGRARWRAAVETRQALAGSGHRQLITGSRAHEAIARRHRGTVRQQTGPLYGLCHAAGVVDDAAACRRPRSSVMQAQLDINLLAGARARSRRLSPRRDDRRRGQRRVHLVRVRPGRHAGSDRLLRVEGRAGRRGARDGDRTGAAPACGSIACRPGSCSPR